MHKMILRLSFLVLVCAATRASADEDEHAKAKAFFDQGMAHFQLQEYDAAIAAWEAGFRVKAGPEFLYNIAQAYRASKRPDRAVEFYQKYLDRNPPGRAEVEEQITVLKGLVERQQGAAHVAPSDLLSPGAATGVPPPPIAPIVSPTAIVAKPPLTKRRWFLQMVGGITAGVVVAVVVGLVVGFHGDGNRTLTPLRF